MDKYYCKVYDGDEMSETFMVDEYGNYLGLAKDEFEQDCPVIDNVKFPKHITNGFCASFALENLENCENQEERVKLAKEKIEGLKKEVDGFKERIKREPRNSQNIEMWIGERYDKLVAYKYYLENLSK